MAKIDYLNYEGLKYYRSKHSEEMDALEARLTQAYGGADDALKTALGEQIEVLRKKIPEDVYITMKVGETEVKVNGQSTLELIAGSNVTLTSDATNKSITITAKDTTYPMASADTDGLLSKEDFVNLRNLGASYTPDNSTIIANDQNQLIVDNVPATKISGVLNISQIPTTALERLYVVANKAALLALTSEQVQNGDTVKVTSYADGSETPISKMFLVVDESKLGTSDAIDAFTEYTASTYWSNIKDIPEIAYKGELAKVATSGSYKDLTDKPTIPSSTNQLTNNGAPGGGGDPYTTESALSSAIEKINASINGINYAGSDEPGGVANSAKKLNSNAGNANTPVYFSDGIPKEVNYSLEGIKKEAYLEWGGKNFSDGYSPIDAAMVPELGANRLAFGTPSAVTVEYSRDAGATWTDYGAPDIVKKELFVTGVSSGTLAIGKSVSGSASPSADNRLRITIDADAYGTYTTFNKFVIYVSTYGSSNCWCTIDASKETSPTEFEVFANKAAIAGWSGYNVINTKDLISYGNNDFADSQYGLIRFTFGCDGHSDANYPGLCVFKILGFGGAGWCTPSNLAKYGTVYRAKGDQSVVFPNTISLDSGKFDGTATRAESLTIGSTGSSTQPVYFENGNPKPVSYPLHEKTSPTAGTYTKVDVNDYGHITSGSNPATLAGYGITDAKIEIESGKITLGSNSIIPITTATSGNNTASFGNSVVVGTVGGVDLKFTMPANPTPSNYLKSASVSGRTLTITPSSGSDVTLDTSYGEATTSSAGLMSAEDKEKLDNLSTSDIRALANTWFQKQTYSAAGSVDSSSSVGAGAINVSSGGIVASGGIKGNKVYNAVWNDLADCIPVDDGCTLEPGRCYVFDGERYTKSSRYLDDGIIGIHSDTYGMHMGSKEGVKQMDVAVAGFVLAYVDKVYRPGTPLTCGPGGALTEILKQDKIEWPEKVVAVFWKDEPDVEWGDADSKVKVDGRKWVKVR